MKYALILLTLMSAFTQAAFKESTMSLTPPTKRVDGTALPASEIKHYLIVITNPDKSVTEVIMTSTSQKWTPPALGTYTLVAYTVDTKGRKSAASNKVTYEAELLIGDPEPPALLITVKTGNTDVIVDNFKGAKEVNGKIVISATSYVDRKAAVSGEKWEPVTIDGVNGIIAPSKGGTDNIATNARVDFLIEATGGNYTVSVNGYAKDGLTDSLYLGLNGKVDPLLTIFAPSKPRSVWLDTTPMEIKLPKGTMLVSLFKRDKSYAVSKINLVKVK